MALSLAAASLLLAVVIAPLSYLLLLFLKAGAPPPRRDDDGDGRIRLPPPSPRGLPVVGHLHLLGSLPHRALRSLARAHGPVLLLRLGRVPTVVVSSAAGAEEVMRTRDLAFASRPRSAVAERLLYGRDVAFAPYGEYWRQARRVCVLHLLSARRVQSFRRVREQEADALVDRVQSTAGAAVGLSALLTEYANAVVSRAAFGDESARALLDGADRGRRVREVLTEFQTLLGTAPVGEMLPWLGWVDAARGMEGKISRTFQALDGLLDKVIHDHRTRSVVEDDDVCGDHHRDFVDVLLHVHSKDDDEEEHGGGGVQLETNEIKAIILDMFAAGTDTVTTAMEWAMAELVTHPLAMRRLQAEIRAAAGSTGSTVTVTVTEGDAAKELPYLRAVLKETLRLHPPIPLLVPREPPADAEILGHHVPAGTRVVVNAWAIGRDPAAWGADAEEFRPERFLAGGGGAGSACAVVDFRGQHMELVPFGAGRRACPGVGFAEASIEMALANLLYHFDWEPAAGGKGTAALDMSEVNGLAVHIRSGLSLLATPWRSLD